MATTNFTRLTTEQLTWWGRDVWKQARNRSFVMSFAGTGADSVIQRVTELKASQKGTRAVMTLVPDLEGDGVVGDNTLEGREEEIKAYDQVIRIDQLRNANRIEGRMADQKSVVNFREQSKDVLAYWLANKIDELAFQTLAGWSYALKPNGSPRVGSELIQLDFAADVSVPTANREVIWNNTLGRIEVAPTNSANLTTASVPTWKGIVQLKAYAVEQFIKPIRTEGGIEAYVLFMHPRGIARLKQDPDFISIYRDAGARGDANLLFKGTAHGVKPSGILIDGVYICEYRNVPTNSGPGATLWGNTGTVTGQAALFCGAQALGFADIGAPSWDEQEYDYGNSNGISISKIFGMRKPVWRSIVTGTNEDFSVIRWNTAL